ncbi:MAG: glucuronate isomerase [Tepidisphaeraceae bacterium]
MNTLSIPRPQLSETITRILDTQPIVDVHTHLYPPTFGTPAANATGQTDPAGLMLWGIDELVTYHYLVAEVYRVVPASKLPYEQFWKMTKRQQADHIWKNLFVEHTPISEACRGVLTTLQTLGLDPNEKSLDAYRPFFAQQDPSQYIDRVMQLANVSSITMTNPVFDDNERNRWLLNPAVASDSRFTAVLRIDPLLRAWPTAAKKLVEWGFNVSEEISAATVEEVRRFLREWIVRQKAIYLAVSLPPEFRYPNVSDPVEKAGQTILEKAILPVCAERGLPFAMMIGSRLRVNPELRDGGDASAKADIAAVVNLCREFPQNKFFVTMLARENQHELCVAARKFGNLMIFGCWWFLNNPSLIEEIERMRLELLGTSFIPQHSDARILDQLLYKWRHSRRILAKVLTDKYADLQETGRHVTPPDIERDVRLMLKDNFISFLTR